MPHNRRNYYRLLHLQPDAPVAVITASYRTLMSTPRHHPDLGGDHESAALINEAYSVLSDSSRRAAYDAARIARAIRSGSAAPETALASSTAEQPSSMASAASEAVPIPASRITGTSADSAMSRTL